MLKIKDDVDLKELEKFGFKIEETFEDKPTELYDEAYTKIELYDGIYDKWNTRIIYVIGSAYLDTVYDLIKADLVEKVIQEEK